jgi:hypothetical protein
MKNISPVFILLVSLTHHTYSINSRIRDHVQLKCVLLMSSQRVHLLGVFCSRENFRNKERVRKLYLTTLSTATITQFHMSEEREKKGIEIYLLSNTAKYLIRFGLISKQGCYKMQYNFPTNIKVQKN